MAEVYKGVTLNKDTDVTLQKQLIDRGQVSKISTLKPSKNFISDFGKSFLDTTSNIGNTVGSIIGGSQLFKGAGYALATPYINKLNEQSLKNGNHLNSVIDNKISQAKKGIVTKKTPDYGVGNIDLNNRPIIKNSDGSISTVRSISINQDGKEVLIPTVRKGLDRIMTNQEAIDWYKKTGENLGKFNSTEEANTYANKLHKNQESIYSGKDNTVSNLLKIKSGLNTAPSITETALSEVPTNRQILSSAGQLALTASLGLKPSNLEKSLLTRIGAPANEALDALNLGKNTLKALNFTGKVTKNVAIGAGMMALGEMELKKDATLQSIVKQAEMGGGIALAAELASPILAKGATKTAEFLSPLFKKAGDNVVEKLNQIAKGNYGVIDLTKDPMSIRNSVESTKKTFSQLVAQKTLDTLDGVNNLKSKFIDRFSAIEPIQQKVEATLGKGVQPAQGEKVYTNVALLDQQSKNAADEVVKDFDNKMSIYKDILPEVETSLLHLDAIDRVKTGIERLEGGIPADLPLLTASYDSFMKGLSPEIRQRIGTARQIVKDWTDSYLDKRVEQGILSKESVDEMKRLHPNYIPHNVIMDAEEKTYNALGSSLNVSKSDINKAIGSLRNITSPIEAIKERTYVAERLLAKNQYIKDLVTTGNKYSAIEGLRPLTGDMTKGKGEETLSFFNNGKLEKWVVPQDLAVSIKNLDFQATPGWFKFITAPSQAMKKMATTLNLSFSVPNKFRDEQTAYTIGNSMIDTLAEKYGLTPQKINMSANEFKDLYRKSGGFGSGIFQEGENALKGNLSKSGLVKVVDKVNPVNILETLNTAIEQDTRLKVFRRALESGATPEDAAFISRNASIDFSKMGSVMKDLNRAIPFLNARVQGFVNMADTLKKNPEMFTRTLLQTSVYPTLVLQQHNMNFDSYANISQEVKNKNFIIMFGETDGYDNSGNKIKIPQFIKIPKGESQSLVANPLQYYLDRQSDIDKRSVQRMLADTVGAASPMSFQSWDSGNMLGSMLSQFGPLVSIPVGIKANQNLFTGAPIIPASKEGNKAGSNFQYGQHTPEYIKDLTKTLNSNFFGIDDVKKTTGGIAPSQVEFVLNSMGGLPQDISSSIDLITGVINNEDAARQPISNTFAGRLAVSPGFRSIIGEDTGLGTTELEKQRQIKNEATAMQGNISIMKNELLDSEIKKINKMDSTSMSNYLKQKVGSGEMSGDDLKELLRRKRITKTIGVLAKSDDPDVKASVIAYQLGELKTPEEKKDLLTNLVTQQVVDANVIKKVLIYQNTGVMNIVQDLKGMNTGQQKQAYLTDLVKKGLIDKDVLGQVVTVMKYEQQ